MSNQSGYSMAMITAWLTSSPDLMDAALPPSPTFTRLRGIMGRPNQTLVGLVDDYAAIRDVAIELSLLCATAMSCWANNMNLDPQDVLRDIALGAFEPVAETE